MITKKKNICVIVISLEDSKGKWIGNISFNVNTLEIEDYLKNGYKIRKEELKTPLELG